MDAPGDMTVRAYALWTLAQLRAKHPSPTAHYHLSVGFSDGKYRAKALINGCPKAHAHGSSMDDALNGLALALLKEAP